MKRLLIVHNLRTGQDVVHEFCDSDFAFELVEAESVADEQGELDVESRLFYRSIDIGCFPSVLVHLNHARQSPSAALI